MTTEPVTIGDLFQPDDEIGQRVFALSAATEDLAIAQRTFTLEREAGISDQRIGYHLRQLIARIYEAERPIVALERHTEACEFAESLPDAQEALSFLRSVYLWRDGEKSKVRKTFGEMRHLTVHHARVGSAELREALRLAADEKARIVRNRSEPSLQHEWPEAVVARYLLGDIRDEGRRVVVKKDGELAQRILDAFGQLLLRARDAHLKRVGIDAERMVHDVDSGD